MYAICYLHLTMVKTLSELFVFSDANGRRVQYLIDDIYVKGTAKDIVAVEDNNYCSDLGGLYIYFYYPGKTVQYQYDWGQTGVKYSSEFKKTHETVKGVWC